MRIDLEAYQKFCGPFVRCAICCRFGAQIGGSTGGRSGRDGDGSACGETGRGISCCLRLNQAGNSKRCDGAYIHGRCGSQIEISPRCRCGRFRAEIGAGGGVAAAKSAQHQHACGGPYADKWCATTDDSDRRIVDAAAGLIQAQVARARGVERNLSRESCTGRRCMRGQTSTPKGTDEKQDGSFHDGCTLGLVGFCKSGPCLRLLSIEEQGPFLQSGST